MLTKEEIWAVVRRQLSLDLGCSPEYMNMPGNQVFQWMHRSGRRTYRDELPFLEILVMDGRLIAAADQAILPWCRAYLLPRRAEWLFQPRHLREIDAALAPYGYCVGEARHFDLPLADCPPAVGQVPLRWYEGEQLEQFRGDVRWNEALAFQPHAPDMLAVAALDSDGALMAMAGASRDGEQLWQIGINVLPPARGKGLGSHLTALLKDELLRRNIVPFYHTEGSHIASLNVGLNAGFRPAFGYLYAQRAQVKG